jgi:hypothetical protein
METKSFNVEKLENILLENDSTKWSNKEVTDSIDLSIVILLDLPETEKLKLVKKALMKALDETAIRLRIVSNEGFTENYLFLIQSEYSGKDAFNLLNKEYEFYFGEKKFLNFEIFKGSLGFN